MPQRLALACGGTLGHVTPALAVAEAWAEAHPDAPPLLVRVRGEPVPELVRASGWQSVELSAEPAWGRPFWGRLRTAGAFVAGAHEASRLVRTEAIGAAISFGGYAGASLAAGVRLGGRPALFHEANAVPGLANRTLAALGVPGLAAFPIRSAPRLAVIGFPVRRAVFSPTRPGPPSAAGPLDVLVTGGSGGSPALNAAAPGLLAATGLQARLRVVHQIGPDDPVPVRRSWAEAGIVAEVVPFIDDIATAFARACLVVATPGAATLAELAALSLPSVLVPRRDVAGDHQLANARNYSENGAALVAGTGPAEALRRLLVEPAEWQRRSAAAHCHHRPDAARLIVEVLERAMALR